MASCLTALLGQAGSFEEEEDLGETGGAKPRTTVLGEEGSGAIKASDSSRSGGYGYGAKGYGGSTREPTKTPTKKPTKTPTKKPTRRPTKRPVSACGDKKPRTRKCLWFKGHPSYCWGGP